MNEESKSRLLKYIYEHDFITVGKLGIDLSGIDLRKVDLSDANLKNIDLVGANLSDATLASVNFENANLTRTELWGADLKLANLRDSTLRNANLTKAELQGADLAGADLTGAILDGANLNDCISVAGQARAGIGDVEICISELAQGTPYLVEVKGESMVDVGISPDDEVIVKIDSDFWPQKRDMIVTHYLPEDASEDDIDSPKLKVALKVYLGEEKGCHKLGWTKWNDSFTVTNVDGSEYTHSGNPNVITTKYIKPIGKVMTVYRKSRILDNTHENDWIIDSESPRFIGESS